MERVSAFTALLKEHLAPADTINAIIRTESGISGTLQLSVGTTLRGDEFTIGCENGVVSVNDADVRVTSDGEETQHSVPNERTGVPPEVRAWGEAIAAGKVREEQEPENALADLELVSRSRTFENIAESECLTARTYAAKWGARRIAQVLPASEVTEG